MVVADNLHRGSYESGVVWCGALLHFHVTLGSPFEAVASERLLWLLTHPRRFLASNQGCSKWCGSDDGLSSAKCRVIPGKPVAHDLEIPRLTTCYFG